MACKNSGASQAGFMDGAQLARFQRVPGPFSVENKKETGKTLEMCHLRFVHERKLRVRSQPLDTIICGKPPLHT